jgi:RHS repeat-associated protein
VRSAVVVQTPELMNYDLDGNLVRDGRWMYSWDAENRLVRVMSWGGADRRRVDWTYDAMGRRVRQVRYVWTNSTWQVVEDLKLVSDPVWFGRHIAELNGTNGAVVRWYVWGLDVSETLDGAGGVGGLLWVRLSGGAAAGVHFVTYDGNGNVWTLVSAATGTETARYEYGPFGEPLRMTGPVAGLNPVRFSTKRTEDGTGLVLYEYRAYSPSIGRWLSRDPIGDINLTLLLRRRQPTAETIYDDELSTAEPANQQLNEVNDYGFVLNTPQKGIDLFGLISFDGCDADQQAQLTASWKEACSLLKDPGFRCCVGRPRLLQMLERRCNWGNIKFKCRENNQGLCPWACAHAWQSLGIGRGVIVVCRRQFDNPLECPLSLKCLLMHELTHIHAGTPFEHGIVGKVETCCINH